MNRTIFLISLFVAILFVSVESRRCRRFRRFRVTRGVARRAAGLKRVVDGYIRDLGGMNNGNNPGPLRRGFRVIDWDADIVPFDMPGDFFKVNVTRGAEFFARRGEFRVSNPPPPPKDDKFDSINRKAARDFITFSAPRLFTPLKDNRVVIDFSIPGRRQDALVKGFGAVYTDVDLRRVTSATYLDRRGCVLAKLFVDPQDRGLSFLGVIFRRPVIAKVILKLGTSPIVRRFGDFVVLDDFIYGEPQKIRRRFYRK